MPRSERYVERGSVWWRNWELRRRPKYEPSSQENVSDETRYRGKGEECSKDRT